MGRKEGWWYRKVLHRYLAGEVQEREGFCQRRGAALGASLLIVFALRVPPTTGGGLLWLARANRGEREGKASRLLPMQMSCACALALADAY